MIFTIAIDTARRCMTAADRLSTQLLSTASGFDSIPISQMTLKSEWPRRSLILEM
jgi:hypothetical protein